jgi:2-hydroxy-3-keto-5-methylthiopentenyl-1-phosphate phosphatase
MKKVSLKVFTDFDGTITSKDLGDELFIQYGSFDELHKRLINDDIRIYEYWKELWKTLPAEFTDKDIYEFALKSDIDAYFIEFVNFLKNSNVDLTIVSDGFESYIKPILEKHNLQDIPYFCNTAVRNTEHYIPHFHGASESCNCKAASCKRNILLNNTNDDDILVYIGDGYSDFCAADFSDIIFAKKSLAAYCNKNKIPHYPFSSFFDIKRILEGLISKGIFKKRNQAAINRKNAFEME